MIRCPNCDHMEFPGALFCSECGAQLGLTSPLRESEELSAEDVLFDTGDVTSSEGGDRNGSQSVEVEEYPDAVVLLHLVDAGKSLPLGGKQEFTIGRLSQDQPVVPDVDLDPYEAYEHGVSRLHALIGVSESQTSIMDLGSANGTRINGVKIVPRTPLPIHNGDLITLGRLKIQIVIRHPE